MASCFSQPHPWTTKTFNLTVFCICHVREGIFLRPPYLNTQDLTHHLLLYKNMQSRPKLCWLMQRIATAIMSTIRRGVAGNPLLASTANANVFRPWGLWQAGAS